MCPRDSNQGCGGPLLLWECHADPAVRRVSKPSPDPIYPVYVAGDANKISETTQVAAVTGQKSGSDQLEDLLRRLLAAVDTQAPALEVHAVDKLLQRLVGGDTESSASGCESSSADGIGTDVALIPRGTAPMTAAVAATATRPTKLFISVYAARMAVRENAGGFIMIPPRVAMDRRRAGGKRRQIRKEGFTSRVSGHVRPPHPGGGGMGQYRLFPTTDDN